MRIEIATFEPREGDENIAGHAVGGFEWGYEGKRTEELKTLADKWHEEGYRAWYSKQDVPIEVISDAITAWVDSKQ